MNIMTIISILLLLCKQDLLIKDCEQKMNNCIDRKIREYAERSPQVFPSEAIVEEFGKECREEIR